MWIVLRSPQNSKMAAVLKTAALARTLRIFPLGTILLVTFICTTAAWVDAAHTWATMTAWKSAHATFYGGEDASGTMGGACGYGDLYSLGYGTYSTALSDGLYNNGLTCGACYELVCKLEGSKWCYGGGKSVIVTATNACPPGSEGGWCDPPKHHYDLSYPMFATLAQPVAGVIPVKYRRVQCSREGGIRFTLDGNPWFNNVLVHNVGGSGDIASVAIRGDKSSGWISMTHNWGQFWSAHAMLVGQSLSFKCAAADGRSMEFWNPVPKNWAFGQTFEATRNFEFS